MADADPRRIRVLQVFAAASGALTGREVESALDAPRTSVRFHLQRLVQAGLLDRRPVVGGGRGRPAFEYSLTPQGRAEADKALAPLAEVLAGALDTDAGLAAARAAGRRWGERIVDGGEGELADDGGVDRGTAAVMAVLERQGFAPQQSADGIELAACPFLALARQHPRVVCGVHAGRLEAIWERLGDQGRATLQPFTGVHLCRIALA